MVKLLSLNTIQSIPSVDLHQTFYLSFFLPYVNDLDIIDLENYAEEA